MEAVIFLTSVTFIVAVGSAIIQGVSFWKRYRVRLQVTSKPLTPAHCVDIEGSDIEANTPIQGSRPLYHSRLGSQTPRRWPGYTDRRFQPVHIGRAMSDYSFAPYQIPEVPDAGTIHHMPLHSSMLPATPTLSATPLATAISAPEAPLHD
ncbi:hypothetical protein N7499_007292 [Penicillium canescens]|uniref:Uncharacterized protein n=1 Tax=Penicillium canescens TaxID=5083 RepID=A0AAD6IGW9_PENCN|nr:uncharacterized protein N7446_002983 [Penicillium canescens]KAJ5996392.1 hypothetical protein N7522_008052 [Penicillium canescens]KAJ6044789.1 hypothetical protein N7460_006144 [Penicillium canescens]KAJ6056258.1 hypothetical protein N7444_005356 [Penicillium canescens]KAJ6075206.1 hypothetical protein N7446_002983 [Penicillium canescens]KAJ6082418.1 hypothetical protein N7499_007292 [Penicillium canescens]